jgi:hypothetical protein
MSSPYPHKTWLRERSHYFDCALTGAVGAETVSGVRLVTGQRSSLLHECTEMSTKVANPISTVTKEKTSQSLWSHLAGTVTAWATHPEIPRKNKCSTLIGSSVELPSGLAYLDRRSARDDLASSSKDQEAALKLYSIHMDGKVT